MPEVFSSETLEEEKTQGADSSCAPVAGKVLYRGKLLNCVVSFSDKIKEPIIIEEGEELKIIINNAAEDLPA